MKKTLKTLLLVFVGLTIALGLAIWIAPWFFKDRLIEVAKKEVNKRIEGEVDFTDVDVTWWSSFPDVTLVFDELRISGVKQDSLQADLLYADALKFSIDFQSVWNQGDSLAIESFHLEKPAIYLYTSNVGQSNYSLTKTTNDAEIEAQSKSIKFDLNGYSISNGEIRYVDENAAREIEMIGVNHRGSLSYDMDSLMLDIQLTGDKVDYSINGIAYLEGAQLDFDGELAIHLENNAYQFMENTLKLNGLELFFDGGLQQHEEAMDIDLSLNTRKNSFRSLLSILPNMYNENFESVDVKGNLIWVGNVKGRYHAANHEYPSYKLNIEVDNGWLKFPNKKETISDIQFKCNLSNSASSFEPTTIQIHNFSFVLNEEEIKGDILIQNQKTNRILNGRIDGEINLKELHAAYPIPSINHLEGIADLDLVFQTNTNALANSNLDEISYSGKIHGSQIKLEREGQPKIEIEMFDASIQKNELTIKSTKGQYGRSDFEGHGRLYPISSIVSSSRPLSIELQMSGDQLDLYELVGQDKTTDRSLEPTATNTENELVKNLILDVRAKYNHVIYDQFQMKSIETQLKGNMEKLGIPSFTGTVNDDDIDASGSLENIYGYMYQKEIMSGRLKVKTPSFDIAHWMTADGEQSDKTEGVASTEYVEIPGRVNLVIDLVADQFKYDNIDVKRAQGQMIVAEQKVSLKNMVGQTLGGEFSIDGYYAHDGNGAPGFKLAYDLQKFSFEETFNKVEMAQFLLPLIKLIKGTFNNKMSLEGKLGQGYFPDLATLDGSGLLETIHGSVVNSNTLKKISAILHLDEIKKWTIDKSRNKFRIENGSLFIEPFNYTHDEIIATISGSHRLTGGLDYKISLNIPTSKFDKLGIPNEILQQYSSIQKQVQKLGLSLGDTESVRVNLFISGSEKDPDIQLKLIDFSERIVNEVIADATKQLIENAKDSLKSETKIRIIDLVDGDHTDSTSTTVTEAIENEVKEQVVEEITPLKDSIISQASDEITDRLGKELDDEIKDLGGGILDGINPFKKKKKEGNN